MTTQITLSIRRLVPLAAVCCALLAVPSLASAAERYATPSASANAVCSQQDPCSLQTAVESAANGDEVIVAPGTYNEGADKLQAGVPNISIHGAADEQRPQISFSGASGAGLTVNGGGTAHVRRLAIDYAGMGTGLVVNNSTGVVEQLLVRTTTDVACELNSSVTLRDSVCASTKNTSAGILSSNYAAGVTWTIKLRNVTAVSNGSPGWGILISTDGTSRTSVDARNVIANGGSGGSSVDVRVGNGGSPTAEAAVDLSSSNYDTRCEFAAGSCNGGAGLSITTPGSGTNQTAAPVFADSEFHQDPTSPTRDKGTTDASVGTGDVDGDQRSQGAAVDIGADEFNELPPPPPPPPPPPTSDPADPPVDSNPPVDSDQPADPDQPMVTDPGDTDPPETAIRKAPPNSLPGTTARFRFVSDEAGSSFQCKLDKGPFRSCRSGRRYRHLDDGRHRFLVRATDAAGNADPTAARDAFRVVER